MSQPFDRMAICPAPVKPDERLKDWWIENPWKIAAKGKSLSGYERNRLFLNAGGQEFFEISGVSGGSDSDGDGRAVVVSDFNNDGRQDFIVRQAGGGVFLMFENRFPQKHWLEISLRGRKTNAQGIGTRLIAEVGSRKLVRELFPANTFKSQGPATVHFGLADAASVDRLTVLWPSGLKQEFLNVPADRHLEIDESSNQLANARK